MSRNNTKAMESSAKPITATSPGLRQWNPAVAAAALVVSEAKRRRQVVPMLRAAALRLQRCSFATGTLPVSGIKDIRGGLDFTHGR